MFPCQDGAEGGGGELAGGLPLHRPPRPPLPHLQAAGARHRGTLLPAPGLLAVISHPSLLELQTNLDEDFTFSLLAAV